MRYLTLISSIILTTLHAQNQSTQVVLDSVQKLDEVIIRANTILGSEYAAQNRTGASYFLSAADLEQFGYADINRTLRAVPGVNLYEEDGYGLRPNISLRGTSPQRSSKITLMEDGVLIAPAPYSAPAAYYFPSVLRMQAIEILKGSSQIQHGPFTTGGAINLVSTAIPEDFSAKIRSSYGSFNTMQLHTSVGQSYERLGYVLEYLNFNSNGFKNLNNKDNTGFDIYDIMGKLKFSSAKDAKLIQSLEVKYHFYDEKSNETYLGLSQADFNQNPYDRYAASQFDQMNAEQRQVMLTHVIDFSKQLRIVTNAYDNKFARNWYKLDDVIFENDKKQLSTILDDPFSFPNHMNTINGSISSSDDALLLKANNRVYYSKGVQTKIDYHWYGSNGSFHDIEIGARLHYDEEDRFQWEDGYRISGGIMALTSMGSRGEQGNRISSANAFASYLLYKYKFNKFTITPGIRYERIALSRADWGKSDEYRGSAPDSRENKIDVLIPGIGFNYSFSNSLSIFGGVHKGFSPPGNAPGEKAEFSINYELGSRFGKEKLRGEMIGFLNDYSNLLGSDLAASGGTGSLDQFNAGAVKVSGLELQLNYNFSDPNAKIQTPIALAYTLTNAIFQNSFGSTQGIWGTVSEGDRVPYIPQQQLSITGGLEHQRYALNMNARYNGAFDTQAANGGIDDTLMLDDNIVIDLSLRYHLNSTISLTANVINLFDEVYATARVPSGLRPGHPFGIYTGVIVNFD
ncbi:MAG: TonB-dependent receptor [Bacteroidetes bacterium]|nr:TonB-dependent receptor [Bacteroidota bacterium]